MVSATFATFDPKLQSLPASASLLRHDLAPIWDQTRNSCTGYASARWLQIIRSVAGLPYVEFSPEAIWFQELIYAGESGQDVGGNAPLVIRVLETLGSMPYGDFPSGQPLGETPPPADWLSSARLSASQAQVIGVTPQQAESTSDIILGANTDLVRAALAEGMPVLAGTELYPSTTSATTETVPFPKPTERPVGQHMWVIEGYDDTKTDPTWPGPGGFLIANSWGTWWGQGGRAWVSYAFVEICAIGPLVAGAPPSPPSPPVVQGATLSLTINGRPVSVRLPPLAPGMYTIQLPAQVDGREIMMPPLKFRVMANGQAVLM